jgi:Carboxypeptidase regulatory-like domain
MTGRLSKSVRLLLLSLWMARILAAQQVPDAPDPQRGTISGTVLDVNGGVVSGANVVLDTLLPDDHRSLQSSDDGFFQFPGLKPGTAYHVVIHAPGFADWSSREVVLTPGQFLMLTDIRLSISTVQVTVNAITPEQLAIAQLTVEEKQRILGFIPNFYVSYDPHPAPLSSRMKYQLAFKMLTDPVTIAGFMLNAGLYQAFGYPRYRGGVAGYGQRLGATFAGGYTKVVIGDAVLASLLHQDPRYFYQGTGTRRSRLMHALSSPFVTRADNGRREINYAELGGDLASGAMANAYYPESERGAGLFLRSALIGASGALANDLIQEFILHKATSRHQP